MLAGSSWSTSGGIPRGSCDCHDVCTKDGCSEIVRKVYVLFVHWICSSLMLMYADQSDQNVLDRLGMRHGSYLRMAYFSSTHIYRNINSELISVDNCTPERRCFRIGVYGYRRAVDNCHDLLHRPRPKAGFGR